MKVCYNNLMSTIILPGFSQHNEEWAKELKDALADDSVLIHFWLHWITQNDSDFLIENEIPRILEKIDDQRISIVAKSIGTFITMFLLEKIPEKINKLVLLGIPFNDLSKEEIKKYEIIKSFDPKKILIIQNSQDPHGSFNDIFKYFYNLNNQIEVLKQDSLTHEYPYYQIINNFLNNN